MDVGTSVWVKTKDATVWAAGEVVDCQDAGGIVRVCRLDTNDVVMRRYPGELCLRNLSADFPTMSSLTSLEHLHEAALLQALSERFAHDQIYTSIGDILVALNPLKPLPSLYSESHLNAYKQVMTVLTAPGNNSVRDKELPPHIFAIGGKAFGGLLKPERRNQSILVSGESGSGKTESTKFLMQFLTSVGSDQSLSERETSGAVEIGRRILQTNPILESFGNAQTIRNDNSSRFGKFIKIQFGDNNQIVGAQIVSYLLEKVRLLHQSPEERSFHIFYELLEGADRELLETLGLQKGGKYELLNSYGPNFARRRAVADKYAQLYVETVRAFEDTGVGEQERLDIFKILAALLHLGNVNFKDAGGQEDATAVTEESRFHLDKCAELMGVNVDKLETLLSSREIKAGMEVMVLKLSPEQAKEICRSLAKAIYGRLFTWLVRRLSDEINYYDSAVSISDEDEELASIGILDIFGFESLNRNGFEQLCINYANERLQDQFNEFVFVREQQVYIEEGIDWRNISYPSNEACLALFDDKSNGLFSLLDQECLMPKGSNQALSTKFYRYHGGDSSADSAGLLQQPQLAQSTLPLLMSSFSRYLHRTESREEPAHQDTRRHPFSASKMERVNHQFVVHHFAGRVCYNVEQFVEKNTDALPADASSILSISDNEVVVAIGSDENVDSGAEIGTTGRRRYSMLRAPSVSAQFKSQLDRLIVQIGQTEAHYVRCLKPNEVKKPGIFDRERMVEQMRSVGVLEAVRIARHGYSVRLAHASFIELFSGFKCFLSTRNRSTNMNNHDLAQALVTVLMDKVLLEDGVEREERNTGASTAVTDDGTGTAFENDVRRKGVQVGKTLVFCKSTTYNRFSRYRLDLRNYCATVIQKHFRGYRRRVLFQELRSFVVHVQSIVRGFLGRRRVDKLRQLRRENNATRIQAFWKRCVAQRKFAEMLRHKRQIAAATRIQANFRRLQAQRILAKMLLDKRQLAAAIQLQANCRRRLAQRELVELQRQKLQRAAAIRIQSQWRRWLAQQQLARMRLQKLQIYSAVRIQAQCRRLLAQRKRKMLLRHKLEVSTAIRIQAHCRRWLAQRKRKQLEMEKRELEAVIIIQRQSRIWLEQNSLVTAKLERFRLGMAFGKLRRACQASQAASEMEAEPSPSDDTTASRAKRRMTRSLGLPITRSSSEQEDSSTSDDRMEPPLRISAPTHRRTNSRQRSRANRRHRSRASSSHVDDRNSLLENEILRLQQMLVEQQNGHEVRSVREQRCRSSTFARPPRSAPLDVNRSRSGRRRFSVGTLTDEEEGEIDDEVSLLPPRRARSVMPSQQVDHVSMLSQKIEELDAKCKFLEQLVARKNYEDAARESVMYGRGSQGGRERFPSADGSLYGDGAAPSEAGSDADSIIFNIQNQMNMLRQSIAVKEQALQTSRKSQAMSFSSSTRPTRSSSAASTMSFSNLPVGEAPPSWPSLPLSESQLSAGGSSHENSRRSGGSSLGLPPTPTSSVASSFYQGPPRSSPAHFGGRGMPRIVKWARSTNCYECEEPFNLFVRRHHCRMCGNSFCHEHSSRRVSVFGIGFDDEPVRVCDNCFAEYYAASQEPLTPQYPPLFGFSSGPLSTSSRLSGLNL
ncbi:Myosin-IB [Phytophthora fragariae]|uniref:Myosin-IB n=1 Tax=Phytophthora fragariae TaxID=53985 RepID=A0A6A3WGE7_9STRA|nr:Myosin-IB [Phytophthora fragariae]KAE8926526.1 Myosin-IB [Phytophthora fragariae]KAE9081779.1 Myosin-IB [Phytophthora fragariae]KAE9105487.1 Myosin-IB [Phytophthora fragariae]KAE9184677.1 Myosin-IB [Phytophthora fragariae]